MAEITASDTLQPVASEPRRRRLEIWLPLLIVVFDQVTKALIRQMVPLHESVPVILENGKPMIAAQSADPIGDRQVTVEVKATILK